MKKYTKRPQPFFEDSFTRYCNNYGLQCSFSDGIVFVKTNLSEWRIYHDERIVKKLYHSSFFTGGRLLSQKAGRLKYGEGFHRQRIPDYVGDDIYDVLRYIARHERNKTAAKVKGTVSIKEGSFEEESS